MVNIYILIEIIATVVENWIVLDFITKLLRPKEDSTKLNVNFVVFLILFSVLVTLVNMKVAFESVSWILYVGVVFAYAMLNLKGAVWKKILFPLLELACIYIINIMCNTLFSALVNKSPYELITERNTFRIFSLFVTKFLFYIVTRAILQYQHKNSFNLKAKEWFTIIALLSLSILTGATLTEKQIVSKSSMDIFYVCAMMFIIIINALIFVTFINASKRNANDLKLSQLEIQVIEQKKAIDSIEFLSKKVRTLQHDLNNHLLCIQQLLKTSQTDKAIDYIDNLLDNQSIKVSQWIQISGVSSIDAILNLKIAKCYENHIDISYLFQADVHNFEVSDFSILIANLFDNSIEASLNTDNPQIHFRIVNDRNYLNIHFKNRCSHSVLKSNSTLATTKEDTFHHGLGLFSVNEIVEKYDGMIDFYEQNDFFIVNIKLKGNNS